MKSGDSIPNGTAPNAEPYGTPCDDPPCDDEGRPRRDCVEKLEAEIATLRDEMAVMKALLAERGPPAEPARRRKSGVAD